MFGRFLRESGLDELPQLVNILRGDMSFVGPRPYMKMQYLLLSDNDKSRNLLKPGLVGLPEVRGRNALTWDHRLCLDRWYTKNISLKVDMFIVIKAIPTVLLRRGVYNK